MPDPTPTPRQFTAKDIQEWYDKAMVGEFLNPYHFEGLGADREEKAQYINEKWMPHFFEGNLYEMTQLQKKWEEERGATPSPTPTAEVQTLGIPDELLQEAIGLAGKYKGVKQ